ncbi:ubiquinone biosynthesis O-methyltransferase, mitochondrial-like [Ruditapes philippinarum]|uniref:ubiquinone biosynthesis O-methyltransferase, mitochondrial-like n=1 Tax=Ruditapes philippinarum TaxID=129788 RepID=UPI00295B1DC1|nr:ubiquinone biosynthesis O-methyltransferase, mitochondrial-like [Ruditapes philippinarum]XP_060607098.1 ubiquinone biosynthesis O-methyltransferase, mitochondrial-like [Ruditapes philippinarum]
MFAFNATKLIRINNKCHTCSRIRTCQFSVLTESVMKRKVTNTCREVSRCFCNRSAIHVISKRKYSGRPMVTNTMDEEELLHFKSLAKSWWNETGEFEALHAMNKLRVPFIRDGLLNHRDDLSDDPSQPLQDLRIVDVGSGGGILSEPLARLGAFVVGLDPVEESTKIAQLHLEEDPNLLPKIKYITGSVEDLVSTESEMFDAVVASEVVEHVADYVHFVESCCALVKPGGSLFITTMNKTQLSRGLAVYAAERIFRVVPEGTHDWEKFVPPEDLQKVLENNNMNVRLIHGMLYLPVLREWKWIKDISINYAMHAVKGEHKDSYS